MSYVVILVRKTSFINDILDGRRSEQSIARGKFLVLFHQTFPVFVPDGFLYLKLSQIRSFKEHLLLHVSGKEFYLILYNLDKERAAVNVKKGLYSPFLSSIVCF